MPSGKNVRPEKWTKVLNVYDDSEYSAIWGNYEEYKNPNRCLGVRWNGTNGECGYPNQGGNSLWYVEPDFLSRDLLLSFLSKVAKITESESKKEYQTNILIALSECSN